ncbi:MAG: DUF2868 domain-containing protein, partial [Proteobacteria bacterium]|nr:DUF2868 domain-containing protein [Pseudomonadota bacterium]
MVLAVAGLLAGIVITLTFLSGDAQGRVNLLYLLFLFAFLPVVGLVLSIFLLLRPSGKSLAAWILDIPFWPQHWHREMLNLGGSDIRRAWFFYQTQLIALCLGAGGLLAFLVLLLGSDVSFVWRSTLLQA